MSDAASSLRQHLTNAFGVPDHLKQAFHDWIESMEDRLTSRRQEIPAADLDAIVKDAVEQHMEANADRYRGEPGEPGKDAEPVAATDAAKAK